jgi:hypothetical protein
MNLRRLLCTSAVRLALRYALFYVALIALALGLLYWSTSRFVDKQLAAGLHSTADALERARADLDHGEFDAMVQAELHAGSASKLHVLIANAKGGPWRAISRVGHPVCRQTTGSTMCRSRTT